MSKGKTVIFYLKVEMGITASRWQVCRRVSCLLADVAVTRSVLRLLAALCQVAIVTVG